MSYISKVFLAAALAVVQLAASSSAAANEVQGDLPRAEWSKLTDVEQVNGHLKAAMLAASDEPSSLPLRERAAQFGLYAWRLERDQAKRLGYARLIAKLGQEMSDISPKHPAGPYWQGIGISLVGVGNGVLSSLQYLPRVQALFGASIERDPTYMGGSAYTSLGRMYTVVPGFPVSLGDRGKAREHLEKAFATPRHTVMNHIYLADLWWLEGNHEQAEKSIEQFLTVKVDSESSFVLREISRPTVQEMLNRVRAGEKRPLDWDVLAGK